MINIEISIFSGYSRKDRKISPIEIHRQIKDWLRAILRIANFKEIIHNIDMTVL
jgi:hypothetical protein